MAELSRVVVLVLGALAALSAGGCATDSAPLSFDVEAAPPGAEITFDDLSAVLEAAVDVDGFIDPTALATKLPRLERQLSLLALPWPKGACEAGSDERLAWLYNSRAAWSLRIIAGELRPAQSQADRFTLPSEISAQRLLESTFPLAGGRTSLGAIDRELSLDSDFRVGAGAPCATDFFGRLPRKPFTAKDIRQSIAGRFGDYTHDATRVELDHDARCIRLPPALWKCVPGLLAEYRERYGLSGVSLPTALMPHLDHRGRVRMQDALAYRPAERTGRAGIVFRPPAEPGRGGVFGR